MGVGLGFGTGMGNGMKRVGTKRLVVATLGLFALAVTAAAQTSTWLVTNGPNLSFEMPGKPVYAVEEGKVQEGPAPFHQYMYDEGKGKRIFIVQTTLYPQAHQMPEIDKALQIMSDAAKSAMDGQNWGSLTYTTSNGIRAADGVGTKNGIEVRMLQLLKDHQVVTLTFGGPKGLSASPDAERFLKSLVLK